jgi:hypothetical protein
MVCNNQLVGSNLGTEGVFEIGKRRLASWQEHIMVMEELLDSR